MRVKIYNRKRKFPSIGEGGHQRKETGKEENETAMSTGTAQRHCLCRRHDETQVFTPTEKIVFFSKQRLVVPILETRILQMDRTV